MTALSQTRLDRGSKILVTGVNGLVASHVAEQALKAGYRIVGTVRELSKAQWMKDKFDKDYGRDSFELRCVPDLAADGAWDEAVKGVSGIAHIASILGSVDPTHSIPAIVKGAVSMLEAAAAQPSVKAVVYTSSLWACTTPKPNTRYHIGDDMWNEQAIEEAWAPPPYTEERRIAVYAAGKAEAEKACWKFMEATKPGFIFNTVLPSANFGRVFDVQYQGYPSTAGWLKDLFNGNINIHPFIPPQYFVDTEDNALLHLACLIDPSVHNERVLASTQPYNWNQILGISRQVYPNRKFIDDIPDQGTDLSTVGNERTREIIQHMGKEGLTSLETSIQLNVQDL